MIKQCNCIFSDSCELIKKRKVLRVGENCKKYLDLCQEKKLIPIINFDKEKLPEKKSDLAICVVAANEYANNQLKITRSSIVEYAKKCKADYIELIGDYYPDWPMLNKYRIYHITSKYEKTLYLDVDIIINEWSPNIFENTPDDKISIYDEKEIAHDINTEYIEWTLNQRQIICEDFEITNNEFYIPNGGVMVIPRILSRYYTQPKKSYHQEWCFDQNYLALNTPYQHINLLSNYYNWSFLRRDFWEVLSDAYFIHLNGSRPEYYRIELLERICNKNFEFFMPPDPPEIKGPESFRPTWFFERKANAHKSF